MKTCAFRTTIGATRMRCSLGEHEGKHRLTVDSRPLCSVDGCVNLMVWRGLCMHHHRLAEAAGTLPPSNRGHAKPIPDEWEKALTAYLAFLKISDVSPNTVLLRKAHIRRMAREIHADPFDVTLDDLLQYVGGQSWKPETARAVRSSARSFYDWAVTTKRMPESPAAGFPRIKSGEKHPRPVEEDDFASALAESDDRTALMLRLAGDLGMRRAEVAQVHRDDLTSTADGWLLKVLGKGRKTRIIPVPDSLADQIITVCAGGFAFPSPNGGHLSPHWVGTIVSRVLPPTYSMHKLRHRALTRAYATSKDILLVSKLAGHASVATTQGYYVAADTAGLRSIVEGISA